MDLDRLERLNRLRDSGALSNEEFQLEKAKVLRGVTSEKGHIQRRWLWWAVPIIVVGLIALVGVFVVDRRGDKADGKALAERSQAEGRIVSNSVEANVPTADAPTIAPPLAFATSTEVIGINPAFLQQRLGVPRETGDWGATYEVGGCTISYRFAKRAVTGFSVDLGPRCRPVIQGRQVSSTTTFAQLKKREPWGSYIASCLTSCGNAADPTIDLAYPGSRATQLVSVSYSTDYDQASKALDLWEQAVRREKGMDEFAMPDDFDAFMCVSNAPDEVESTLRNAKVRSVRVSGGSEALC